MQYNKLEDYIYIVKNALSHEVCDEILDEFTNSDEWTDTVVGKGEVIKNISINKNFFNFTSKVLNDSIKSFLTNRFNVKSKYEM